MLQVTIDAFSGRENPSYILSEEKSRELLTDVGKNLDVIENTAHGFDGLGLRGVIVNQLDDTSSLRNIPAQFKISNSSSDSGNSLDLIERLIRELPQNSPAPGLSGDSSYDDGLVEHLLQLLGAHENQVTVQDADGLQQKADSAQKQDVTCYIERSVFNPDFWNADSNVRTRNNCYNYASNWRTNTFAQPGRGAGQMYSALTCASVTKAALADGCHHRYDCFPDSEKPRRLVALVVAPGYDYHWYRIHSVNENFWGHKPGGTAARNTDNSGFVIRNPETCDRGPYTDFCGYFYTCRTQREKIR